MIWEIYFLVEDKTEWPELCLIVFSAYLVLESGRMNNNHLLRESVMFIVQLVWSLSILFDRLYSLQLSWFDDYQFCVLKIFYRILQIVDNTWLYENLTLLFDLNKMMRMKIVLVWQMLLMKVMKMMMKKTKMSKMVLFSDLHLQCKWKMKSVN